jgi:hypothetical protein
MYSVASTSVADLLLFLRDFRSVIFLEVVQQAASLRRLQTSAASNAKVCPFVLPLITAYRQCVAA